MQTAIIILGALAAGFSFYALLVAVLYMRASRQYHLSTEYLIQREMFLSEVHRRMGDMHRHTAERWDVFFRMGVWN